MIPDYDLKPGPSPKASLQPPVEKDNNENNLIKDDNMMNKTNKGVEKPKGKNHQGKEQSKSLFAKEYKKKGKPKNNGDIIRGTFLAIHLGYILNMIF